MTRTGIAQDTVRILERGDYVAPGGRTVSIADSLARCVAETRALDPEALEALREKILASPASFERTVRTAANETTLEAAERLSAQGDGRLGVLNFASARNPGGGFLGGAQAQEESLARSSGLYASLRRCPAHYDYHRQNRLTLYSDRMILSPGCPVFRRDDGTLLVQPYTVDFVTSPAPNAGALSRNDPALLWQLPTVLDIRVGKLLALFADSGCTHLILGAWGCGVFRNDPHTVASVFDKWLGPGAPFDRRFAAVHYAVLDTRPGQLIYTPFAALADTETA